MAPDRGGPVRDYTCDLYYAEALRRRLDHYYTSRGYKNVKVWIVDEKFGNQTYYWIRSNIKFNCAEIAT